MIAKVVAEVAVVQVVAVATVRIIATKVSALGRIVHIAWLRFAPSVVQYGTGWLGLAWHRMGVGVGVAGAWARAWRGVACMGWRCVACFLCVRGVWGVYGVRGVRAVRIARIRPPSFQYRQDKARVFFYIGVRSERSGGGRSDPVETAGGQEGWLWEWWGWRGGAGMGGGG